MAVKAAIVEAVEEVARSYPEELVPAQLWDVPRISFNAQLIVDRVGRDVSVCDIGSGVGMFGPACARLGMRATVMDDYDHPYDDPAMAADLPEAPDAINVRAQDVLGLHRAAGVEIAQRDPLTEGFGFPAESLDVVTSFASMEHWHNSPKRLFAEVRKALVPGGLFILNAPNCASLASRIKVPLGLGKWSEMADWYEPARFRGHVREPDVADFRYIAKDMGLVDVEILGRNFMGQLSPRREIRLAAHILDRILRPWPTLCGDIYLIGRKPGSAGEVGTKRTAVPLTS